MSQCTKRFPLKELRNYNRKLFLCLPKCDQIRSFLRIWSHLLKKSLMENFIFCAVVVKTGACQIYVNNNAIVTETEIKSDREAYSEPCQKSKMERFAKITANYFRKTRHITCLTGF